MNIRKLLYWISDTLKGSVVSKHYKEVFQDFHDEVSARNKLSAKLNRLLTHARNTVPYYQRMEIGELQEFPVLNKNEIRASFDQFKSDGYPEDQLKKVITSGSTGTPFSVYHDGEKAKRNTADTMVFGKLAGFEFGTKLYYLKIWNKVNAKTGRMKFIQNIVPEDVTQLSDNYLTSFVERLRRDKSKKSILGYASALETITRYLHEKMPGQKLSNVQGIIGMSEGMSQYTKEKLSAITGVMPVSRYSNVENGIIAQQMPDGGSSFLINWSSYFVEILQMDSNEPEKLGSPGRIVITDLFNFAFPMIRYDTGDIGVMEEEQERLVLKRVEGRKMDAVFDTEGNLVSSFTITNNMWLFPEIKQYQFIQKSKAEYLFVLNTGDAPFLRQEELKEEFSKHFGKDASFALQYVNEIPLLNSGKRRKVINEYRK